MLYISWNLYSILASPRRKFQSSSVAQSCPILCNPMDCSMPGLTVHYSSSCLLSWWCHPTISPSVIPFSSCLQPFPVSGSFPVSQFSTSGGQSIGVSASVLSMNIQDWFPLGWAGWISLQSKGLSRVFSNLLATWCKELSHLKRLWCWERLKVGGEEDDRGWDGWMASPTEFE